MPALCKELQDWANLTQQGPVGFTISKKPGFDYLLRVRVVPKVGRAWRATAVTMRLSARSAVMIPEVIPALAKCQHKSFDFSIPQISTIFTSDLVLFCLYVTYPSVRPG